MCSVHRIESQESSVALTQRVLACGSLDKPARAAVADDVKRAGLGQVNHRGATPVVRQPPAVKDVSTLSCELASDTRPQSRTRLIPKLGELIHSKRAHSATDVGARKRECPAIRSSS